MGATPANRGPVAPVDTAAMQALFEDFAKGEVKADTIGRLLGICDHDFWKGAAMGAAAGLLVANIPAIRAFIGAMLASAPSEKPSGNKETSS